MGTREKLVRDRLASEVRERERQRQQEEEEWRLERQQAAVIVEEVGDECSRIVELYQQADWSEASLIAKKVYDEHRGMETKEVAAFHFAAFTFRREVLWGECLVPVEGYVWSDNTVSFRAAHRMYDQSTAELFGDMSLEALQRIHRRLRRATRLRQFPITARFERYYL